MLEVVVEARHKAHAGKTRTGWGEIEGRERMGMLSPAHASKRPM